VRPKERKPAPKPAAGQGHFGRHAKHGTSGRPERRDRADQPGSGGRFWLYGIHAAKAALANKRRKYHRILVTERTLELLPPGVSAETLPPDAISRLLPQGAVHQGIALLCDPLPALVLEDAVELKPPGGRLVVVLDQVTDPHNEGAILRSAAAFGAAAVVVQDRHAPPESGVLAKAASGALDVVPRVAVVNIARTLERLGRLGFWRIALASDGDSALSEAATKGDVALVLGAEGAGLRRLVREHCDVSAHIPVADAIGSLNVSNAAAIAFYELRRIKTP
jgi:23S rRNA (guanosine2251-2'-O)-methyltransferase